MILTWFRLWPLLILPFLMTFLLGLIPSFLLLGKKEVGGFLIREPFVEMAEYVLPGDKAGLLHDLYYAGDYLTQVLIHAVLALNLNLLLLPFIYAVGAFLISVSSWVATTELDVKTQTARR